MKSPVDGVKKEERFMKIWKASLSLNPSQDEGSENRFQTYFRISKCKEDYKYIDERKDFFCSDGWINGRVPYVMGEEIDTYDVVKIIQGFDKEPTEKEKNEIEMQMRLYMVEILQARRESFLSNSDEQLYAAGETIKYRYEVTGTTNDGKIFHGKCVAYDLDSMGELFKNKGFRVYKFQSRELADANSEVKIEEFCIDDEI